ncbi:MAG: hypothetical protein EBS96_13235, partial [Spartobacteria bacterium]|nr:hypothetical protein [Spartobacteria bacterium]
MNRGCAWAGQASAAFSNSFPIKLARNSKNTTLIRYAAYPLLLRSAQDVSIGAMRNHQVAIGLPSGESFCKRNRKLACKWLFKTAPAFG